jgi:multidrug transporter EmrE-like cation transporter
LRYVRDFRASENTRNGEDATAFVATSLKTYKNSIVNLFEVGPNICNIQLHIHRLNKMTLSITTSYKERQLAEFCGVRPGRTHWLSLGVAIVASQMGQVLLKLGATGLPTGSTPMDSMLTQLLRWETIIGLGCYGSGTLFYVVALRRIPMSVALPCTAVSYVAATVFGTALFQEALSILKVIGLLMVCVGVIMLADGESGNPPPVAGEVAGGRR